MPSSLVGEFAHIARQYVRDVEIKAQAQSAMSSRQAEGVIGEPVGAVAREIGNNLVWKIWPDMQELTVAMKVANHGFRMGNSP